MHLEKKDWILWSYLKSKLKKIISREYTVPGNCLNNLVKECTNYRKAEYQNVELSVNGEISML